MSGNLPIAADNNLFAAVDMGTNTFKLLIARVDPTTGRFLTLTRSKHQVLLGLTTTTTTSISPASLSRATSALRTFQNLLESHHIPPSRSRFVATSAVREASNQSQFLSAIHQTLGGDRHVEVLSGTEEARLIYLGILQFHPVYDHVILTIDIGGGSTEFAIGEKGNILFSVLALGHITLTQKFPKISEMRRHIRSILRESGLNERVIKRYNVDRVIGSSGTIRNIEKAIFRGKKAGNLGLFDENRSKMEGNVGLSDENSSKMAGNGDLYEENERDWSFTIGELRALVEKLSEDEGGERRRGFFKKRSEFIVAGAVLLEEIFEELKIEEMKVSGYALAEGVIAEKLGGVLDCYDPRANARWRSVVRLATRFNGKERMKSASLCFSVAKEMFDGLRKRCEPGDGLVVSLENKDLEYLEAACLLHKIGLYMGNKGYHKRSYHMILSGDHLSGYNDEEVKLIALLVRHHRKKLPKSNHRVVEELTEEMRRKLGILCPILCVSAAIEKLLLVNIDNVEFSHTCEGYKLVIEAGNFPSPDNVLPSVKGFEAELDEELKHFRMVFQQRLSISFTSNTSS